MWATTGARRRPETRRVFVVWLGGLRRNWMVDLVGQVAMERLVVFGLARTDRPPHRITADCR
jgi:hypothetical protein